MKPPSHRTVTEMAFALLNEMNLAFPPGFQKSEVANESEATDYYLDLEFVDVRGGFGSGGRDNPHENDTWAIDDKPRKRARSLEADYYFTAFNHFIDIKKGPGVFDDYDGYSYGYGSASKDQYQEAGDATSDFRIQLVSKIANAFGVSIKVDQGINWWFRNDYVHIPGRAWYRNCSPSVVRYSFFGDKGLCRSIEEEAAARFPLGNAVGTKGTGIPYSVFMPVDNMARFHFNRFAKNPDPTCLGPVMHAIHDASIPHHAAGLCGNWHGQYEQELGDKLVSWTHDPQFLKDTQFLFSQWWTTKGTPPQWMRKGDEEKAPAINWPVETLVTWLALNAYDAYSTVYDQFRKGYVNNEQRMRELTTKATAMSMLVLCKATGQMPP